jgi:hypothetical protein
MNILSVHWNVLVLWKVITGTARLYTILLLVFGSYAGYSLIRVFVDLSRLREKASLRRVECRIERIRQIILVLLLLLGMTIANDAFVVYRALRYYSRVVEGDGIDGFGPWMVFIFCALGVLAFLHVFQWIASDYLQRRVTDLSG